MSFYPNIEMNSAKNCLVIHWSQYHIARYCSKWLRFHCQCENCKLEKSKLDKLDFADSTIIKEAEFVDDWFTSRIENDKPIGHIIKIPKQYLLSNCICDSCLERDILRHSCTARNPKEGPPTIDYEIVLSERGLFKCLGTIIQHGFCLITDFPVEPKFSLLDFIERIGPIQPTCYHARYWELISQPNPISAAYTNQMLPPHQDLTMYETAPGVLFLHTLRFEDTVEGGESRIIDLFPAAEELREKQPKYFEDLCRIPGSWHTKDMDRENPIWFHHSRPHIEVDYFGKIVAVNWNQACEAPLRCREEDVETYYRSYRAFSEIIDRDSNQFRFRLKEGDLLIINNHRMAHSRTAYSCRKPSERHILGSYVDLDDLKCKYMVMAHKLGIDVTCPKVGNRSSF